MKILSLTALKCITVAAVLAATFSISSCRMPVMGNPPTRYSSKHVTFTNGRSMELKRFRLRPGMLITDSGTFNAYSVRIVTNGKRTYKPLNKGRHWAVQKATGNINVYAQRPTLLPHAPLHFNPANTDTMLPLNRKTMMYLSQRCDGCKRLVRANDWLTGVSYFFYATTIAVLIITLMAASSAIELGFVVLSTLFVAQIGDAFKSKGDQLIRLIISRINGVQPF